MSKLILHLDDEPAIREILAAHLADMGHRVVSVETPMQAMNAAKQTPPDLFISDLQLEEEDGVTTIAALREALPNMPILVLTGVLIDSKMAITSVAPGASSYLPKTAPLARIAEEVRRLLGP
jgi:DNA-binding NtrC family response regulator